MRTLLWIPILGALWLAPLDANAAGASSDDTLMLAFAEERREERQDRRDERGRSDERQDRRDCRQEEGRVGSDKRECKQEEVRDGRGGDDEGDSGEGDDQ